MILAGDIGATHSRLAAFETEGNRLQCAVEKIYSSGDHKGLAEIVADFTKTEGIPAQSACFGVAGPVRGGRSRISNLPWIIDSRELAAQLKLRTVGLINDLEAFAYGIDVLESKDFVTLSEGSNEAAGNTAVVSAGTGLGEAGLYWDGFRHHPFACEGGHTEFAPKNAIEIELLQYLMKKYQNQHVSYERILSGPGIKNIYDFLRDTSKRRRANLVERPVGRCSRCTRCNLAVSSYEQSRNLRANVVNICQCLRFRSWKLCSEIHGYGRDFRCRHRGKDRVEDEGRNVHGRLPRQRSHEDSTARNTSQDCPQ